MTYFHKEKLNIVKKLVRKYIIPHIIVVVAVVVPIHILYTIQHGKMRYSIITLIF